MTDTNPFDELTLAEVQQLRKECLGGATISDADPLDLAGAVMYFTQRRNMNGDAPSWPDFLATTKMREIKAFADLINEETADPTNGVTP
jgi:hypothetical protein